MTNPSPRRSGFARALFMLVTFFAVCGVAGSLLQKRVGAQSAQEESQFRDSYKSFSDVYAVVEQNYAEPITGDKVDTAIYDGAIPGMLRVLDPHSNFFDPKAYAKFHEDQHGRYYGVGMTIQQPIVGGKTYVVFPFENSPAFNAGIHPGDIISAIDGKTAEGMTSDTVAKTLKGPKGTHVQVTMAREGVDKPLNFDLIRDEIQHPSVDLKYEIRPNVGYIHLTQFQETSGQEVREAIEGFGDLNGLILDLRGNPGGLLSQAVDICDHLLAKDQMIVSQRGRVSNSINYSATHGNGGKAFPIVVLVNRGSASAAEIVTGALQDHDRALVLGETTFGKGLVQTVFDIGDHTMGLALTTFHYYTPSGRLIQRNYSGVSLYDYFYNHAGAQPADTTNREVKLTDAGRTVYGGGGITPDVHYEAPKSSEFQDRLAYEETFFHFAPIWVARHPAAKDIQVDAATMKDFEAYLTQKNIPWKQSDMDAADLWVKVRIKQSVVTILNGETAGLRTVTDWDPEIQKAIGLLPEAQALEDKAHKVLTAKAEARGLEPESKNP